MLPAHEIRTTTSPNREAVSQAMGRHDGRREATFLRALPASRPQPLSDVAPRARSVRFGIRWWCLHRLRVSPRRLVGYSVSVVLAVTSVSPRPAVCRCAFGGVSPILLRVCHSQNSRQGCSLTRRVNSRPIRQAASCDAAWRGDANFNRQEATMNPGSASDLSACVQPS